MGAWIETVVVLRASVLMPASHPVWVRGLKPSYNEDSYDASESHPVWVRGLKHLMPEGVTPEQICRTPCGCVD